MLSCCVVGGSPGASVGVRKFWARFRALVCYRLLPNAGTRRMRWRPALLALLVAPASCLPRHFEPEATIFALEAPHLEATRDLERDGSALDKIDDCLREQPEPDAQCVEDLRQQAETGQPVPLLVRHDDKNLMMPDLDDEKGAKAVDAERFRRCDLTHATPS